MTEPRVTRRFNIRFWATVGGLFAAWLVVGYLVLPSLVRSAYEGTSFELLNRLISGRDIHPVERYLGQARGLANLVSIALAVAVITAYASWVWRAQIRRGWHAVTLEGARSSAGGLLITAAWLGLVFGFTEAAVAWVRFRALGVVTVFNNPDALWTAPLGLGLLFAVGALVLITVLRGWRRELSYRLVVGIGATLGLYSLVRGLELGLPPLRLGLHPLAIAVLALALGVQLTRRVDASPALRRFMRASALPLAVLFVAAPLISSGIDRLLESRRLAGLPEAVDAPNVILIVLDTVRKESLGLHGYPRPNTPELQDLARASVVFERAIATSSWTLPSHGSLFTGRYQYELSTDRQEPLDDTFPTLAEFLRERGYATGGFVANLDYTTRESGLDRGFMHYAEHTRSIGSFASGNWLLRQVGPTVWGWLPMSSAANRKYAPLIVNQFLGWRDRVEDRPYFAFLNMYDAHAPYEIHEEFLARFPPERPITREQNTAGEDVPLTPDMARHIDGYDTGIALMDDAIGRLIDELENRGERDNTILIITSDHGEHLGDHGMLDHHNSLYAQLVLVPLLVSAPDGSGAGLRIEAPVTIRDIPATVADLAGLEDAPFAGASLTRTWEDSTYADRADWVLAEVSGSGLGDVKPHEPIFHGPMKSVVERSLHYIRNGDGSEELYDLEVDPHEMDDLSASDLAPLVFPRFRALLDPVVRADTLVYSSAYERAGGR